jgi:hypothetical protein
MCQPSYVRNAAAAAAAANANAVVTICLPVYLKSPSYAVY